MYLRDGLQRGELKGIGSAVGGVFQVIGKGFVVRHVSNKALVRFLYLVESVCRRPAFRCKSTSIPGCQTSDMRIAPSWDHTHSKSKKTSVDMLSVSIANFLTYLPFIVAHPVVYPNCLTHPESISDRHPETKRWSKTAELFGRLASKA
jgi:hypothetical protein